MANAPARKPKRAAPSRRKTSTGPMKPRKCEHCGKGGSTHLSSCPRWLCPECKMIGGKHAIKCKSHPDNQPIAPGAKKPSAGDHAARSEAGKRGSQAPTGLLFKVVLIPGALDALQKSINDGDFSGDSQRQDQCDYEEPGADGGAVRCTNLAQMKKVVKNHCEACERDKKTVAAEFCVGHAINVWGGKHPYHLQTALDLK